MYSRGVFLSARVFPPMFLIDGALPTTLVLDGREESG